MKNNARLILRKDHYILRMHEMLAIKKEKDLYKHFSNKSKSLKDYIKSGSLDIDRHED